MLNAPGFTIEQVTDVAEAWPVLEELFLDFEAYNADFLARTLRPDWRERWREPRVAPDDRLVLVAYAGSGPAGYLQALVLRDQGLFEEVVGEVTDLFVRPESRRNYIGRSLLRRAEVWARGRGATELRLNVHSENKRGVRFWTLNGYRLASMTLAKRLAGGER